MGVSHKNVNGDQKLFFKISFCWVQQKKINSGLEQLEGEYMTRYYFHFWEVIYPFRSRRNLGHFYSGL